MHFQRSSILSLAFVAIGLVALPARAQLVAFDSFETYSAGALNGSNGGTGWTAAWTATANAAVQDVSGDSLTYDGGAFSIDGGDRAIAIQGSSNPLFTRSFTNIAPGDSDEVFFSFLFRENNSTGSNDFMNFFVSNDGDRSNSGGMGLTSASSGQFGTRVTASGATNDTDLSTTTPVAAETYFLVGRFSRDGTSGDPLDFDLMQLWINPTTTDFSLLGTADSQVDFSSLIDGDISFFGARTVNILAGTEEYNIDELRIGTSYLGVLIPEPTSGALFLGAAALLAFRRRRQA
ncbi:MAG: PEP-CTERM sorting domain-containing protein [Verrucomicrobiota bacterium]